MKSRICHSSYFKPALALLSDKMSEIDYEEDELDDFPAN
jgi:hypothetical protein